MTAFDPRVHAVRPDLADRALAGRLQAARFVDAQIFHVAVAQAPVRGRPVADAPLTTEALFGEAVRVFDATPEGWAWGQLAADRYVGWLPLDALAEGVPHATHKVSALRTFAFARPDIKSPPLLALPLGATVAVHGEAEDRNARYGLLRPTGAVVLQHLASLDAKEPDCAAVAERFVGAPYLWGGKTGLGLDCSGLVQAALRACGIEAPRDSDMQEAELGDAIAPDRGLQRGDLVFWKGHVGIMLDAQRLIHANAHHMAVAVEPLAAATERFARKGSPVTSVRRLIPPTVPTHGLGR